MTQPSATSSAGPLVVVVAGGDALDPAQVADVGDALVVAADSGIDRALEAGLLLHHAVGDLDSVSPSGLAAAVAGGAEVHRYPPVKDATDLELALDLACSLGAQRILVVGGHGGRLDHFLANVALLASAAYTHVEMGARMGSAVVTIVRAGAGRAGSLTGGPGQLVSLLPMHGAASGVRTQGLAYRLAGETLHAGSSRGVSNRFRASTAAVSLTGGVLAAIQPGTEKEEP